MNIENDFGHSGILHQQDLNGPLSDISEADLCSRILMLSNGRKEEFCPGVNRLGKGTL